MENNCTNSPNCETLASDAQTSFPSQEPQTEQRFNEHELLLLNIDDIELILEDQLDLYNSKEISFLKERLTVLRAEENALREKQEKSEREKRLLQVIKCPKCDGENPSSNLQCQYCSYTFKEKDYYARPEVKKARPVGSENSNETNNRGLYFLAFFLPPLGILLGLVYIAKNEDALGKSLIISSVIGTLVITLIGLLLSGTLADILSSLGSKTCHNCGKIISDEAVKAGGRYFCSYDCCMQEVLFD